MKIRGLPSQSHHYKLSPDELLLESLGYTFTVNIKASERLSVSYEFSILKTFQKMKCQFSDTLKWKYKVHIFSGRQASPA